MIGMQEVFLNGQSKTFYKNFKQTENSIGRYHD